MGRTILNLNVDFVARLPSGSAGVTPIFVSPVIRSSARGSD